MPKKTWTDEERKAFGAKMKAKRAEKANKTRDLSEDPETPVVPEQRPDTVSDDRNASDYETLLQRIQELEAAAWRSAPQPSVQAGPQGLTGTYEKYSTDKAVYPDPRERLALEARLAPVAFKYNYELAFDIGVSNYTTIDGIRMKEPKFTLELVRIMLDEDTGEQTNGRYVVCRLIMHEDPDAALVIAKDNGITIEAEDEATFLNEMRYLRMRDWLLECFYPPAIKAVKNQKEIVIGGKLVTYYEVNNEQGKGLTKTDWDNAPKIKF